MAASAAIPIALSITDLDVGGAEKIMVELVTRLDRQRFAPAVYVLGRRPQGEQQQLVQQLERAGVPVAFLGGVRLWHAPGVVRRLAEMFNSTRPQILQNFLWHANLLGAMAGHRAGVPHILSGIRVAAAPGGLYGWLARRADGYVERHVCVSKAVEDHFRSVSGVPTERTLVIPNGVDLERFPATAPADLTEFGLPSGRRAISYLGRLDHQKNVEWLVNQTPLIFKRLENHDLLIVGRGTERRRLEATCDRLGVDRRVHFAGWQRDTPGIIAASDVIVLPSRYEGMPNVVLEAMAGGKPVVATDVQGVRELLGDGDEQIVSGSDAAQFTDRIATIAGDPSRAQELGAKNRRRAAEHFSIERMVSAYEQLYASLLEAS